MFRIACSTARGTAVRSIIRLLLVTALVSGAFENHASAESISFNVTFGPTTSPFDTTYVLGGFDPSLDTLNAWSVRPTTTAVRGASLGRAYVVSHANPSSFRSKIQKNATGGLQIRSSARQTSPKRTS